MLSERFGVEFKCFWVRRTATTPAAFMRMLISSIFIPPLFASVALANDAEDDFLLLIPSLLAQANQANPGTPNQASQFSINANVVKFGTNDTEAELKSRGAASVAVGSRTIYIGTQQKTSINQDPIIRAFDSGNQAQAWTATDFEATGADGRGVSLFWSGTQLYASFTVDGTQGQPSQDFRRASQGAQQSWMRSYGMGGGPKASVVALIDQNTGNLLKAVYLTAVLSSGKSNTLLIKGLSTNASGNLVVSANSFFAPRNVSGQALPRLNSGPSPFNYTLELAADLSRAINASSTDF